MKKLLCLIVVLVLALSMFAACQKKAENEVATTEATTEAVTEATEEVNDDDGQNPVMNFIGVYQNDRCTITVGAKGNEDAEFVIEWGSSATETTKWTMSGYFDADTLRVNYSDAVKTNLVYDENGEVTSEEVEYEDGAGRIQFHDDGTLSWEDHNEEEQLVGNNLFEYVTTEE
jgi:hypothetical protein